MSRNMLHQSRITSVRPGCFFLLVDQSDSMNELVAGSPRSKAEIATAALNRFISELNCKSERGEEKPRRYFDVAVIGYTTDGAGRPRIQSLLQGGLAGREIVSIVDLYDEPLDIETRDRDDGAERLPLHVLSGRHSAVSVHDFTDSVDMYRCGRLGRKFFRAMTHLFGAKRLRTPDPWSRSSCRMNKQSPKSIRYASSFWWASRSR
jgi:hypothetical protein